MTGPEFSNQFDVLFNNVTSNQAPGLDSYEKSVFLTKAQNELILNYFNSSSKGNNVQQGYDDTTIRQSDFSNLMRSWCTGDSGKEPTLDPRALVFSKPSDVLIPINEQLFLSNRNSSTRAIHLGYYEWYEGDTSTYWKKMSDAYSYPDSQKVTTLDTVKKPHYGDVYELVYYQSEIPKNSDVRQVIPITYTEYLRLMSKPFKEPLKWQAWRLNTDTHVSTDIELIMTSEDKKYKTKLYSLRYIKKPRPIILEPLQEQQLTLEGHDGTEQAYAKEDGIILNPCELNDIMHEQVLQRAVEIAKTVWMSDASQVQLYNAMGQRSE